MTMTAILFHGATGGAFKQIGREISQALPAMGVISQNIDDPSFRKP